MNIEDEFISYTDCNEIEAGMFQFMDVNLIKDIGVYKKGEFIPLITFDYVNSLIKIYTDNTSSEPEKTYKISLNIITDE